jgi:hypothetical protein
MNDGESHIDSPQDVVVLATKHDRYAVADVLDSAWFRGELPDFWHPFLVGLAGERDPHGVAPTSEVLQSLSEEIRYNLDLITSEETESWLRSHRLSLQDLTDYCHRRYGMQHAKNPPPPEDIDYLAAAPALRESFLKELLFAGNFAELVRRLTWRVAASVAAETKHPLPADLLDAQCALFFQRSHLESESLPGALRQIGRERRWFEAQIELEACYRWHCDRVCTTENRAHSLAASRLALTRFEVEMMDLESEEAAREACFCLETDGQSMTELAEQEHYRIERREFLLEDIPEDLQPRFLGAETGQVRQITTAENRFEVYRILGKREPTLVDANIVRRIDGGLLTTHFEYLLSQRMAWLVNPGAPS